MIGSHHAHSVEAPRPGAGLALARWRLGSTPTIIALIAGMVTLTIASFLHITREQHEMEQIRETTRLMRMTRQALMEADMTVLRFLAKPAEREEAVAYGKAIYRLETFSVENLPATLKQGAEETPATQVLESLKDAWTAIVAKLDAGGVDDARAIYEMRRVDRDMNAFIAGFVSTLDRLEVRYAALQRSIDRTIWACLTGQILSGVFSILAFLMAARRGAREAEARAQARAAADETREQVMRLFEMTDMLQSAGGHADANAVLTATAVELLPGLGGALYVFNNSHDRLTLATHWGVDEAKLGQTIGLQQCWALKRGKPHLNGARAGAPCCDHHQAGEALEIPMIARGEILGLLQIHAEGPSARKKLTDVTSVATALADAMSLALANLALRDKLRSQALRDPLTGLYNRRYMEDTLERLVKLGGRDRSAVSLIMIDLDRFKQLNDSYGHAKGDAVLRDVASVIVASLRESDVACRYGGEELLVILPQCELDMAANKAERLRTAIEALSEPKGAQISASFGVASIPATSGSSIELLAAADAALYEAKENGRNRVIAAARRASDATEAELIAALQAAE